MSTHWGLRGSNAVCGLGVTASHRGVIPKVGSTPTPCSMTEPPSAARLWEESKGDHARYRELMLRHGHIVQYDTAEEANRHPRDLPCGWPGNAQ